MAFTVDASTRLVLTANPDLRAKLERKLKEYFDRMMFRAPETDPHGWYKLRALECLLTKGELVVAELQAEVQRLSWYYEYYFLDAIAVVNAYNDDRLDAIRGGTGLK